MKIKHHEFWNTHLFHFPIYLYWLYLSIRARSLFFFSAANPGIESGGMVGESKFEILKKINSKYLPVTIFYKEIPIQEDILKDIFNHKISFPFIVKPDVGQGGWLIELIHSPEDLSSFLSRIKIPFMVQEYIDEALELGVLYCRLPHQQQGTITSLVAKELLTVEGDGKSSIETLFLHHARVRKPISYFKLGSHINLKRIPALHEKVVVSYMANHSYGTTYINWNNKIDEEIIISIDKVSQNIEGFYFGRFDIRCKNLKELKQGNFKILELNGVGAIPLHIFDPNETLKNAYSAAFHHWKTIYNISQSNIQRGVTCMTLKEAWDTCKNVFNIQKLHALDFTIGN